MLISNRNVTAELLLNYRSLNSSSANAVHFYTVFCLGWLSILKLPRKNSMQNAFYTRGMIFVWVQEVRSSDLCRAYLGNITFRRV